MKCKGYGGFAELFLKLGADFVQDKVAKIRNFPYGCLHD